MPVSGKGRSFGKVGVGPFSWFFSSKSDRSPTSSNAFDERSTINALKSDKHFVGKIERFGMPWRGVQERIKEELPSGLADLDQVAYRLVPRVMNSVFGQQEVAWKTERRPSKSGSGHTTWIVIT